MGREREIAESNLSSFVPQLTDINFAPPKSCVVAGNVTAKLTPKPNASSFVGLNVQVPPSVSAQVSEDGKSTVVRVVHHGIQPIEVRVSGGGSNGSSDPKATALSSEDLNAENTPADVDNVSPVSVPVKVDAGGITLQVPGQSFTVIEM